MEYICKIENCECIYHKKLKRKVTYKIENCEKWLVSKRQANLLKNFMNKLYSAENFSTKLGTPRLKRLPTD